LSKALGVTTAKNDKISIIVDANAFIKQIPLPSIIAPKLSLEEFNERYELVTLTEVVRELKDAQTRQYVENIPYDLKIVQGSTLIDS
jgi:rRNA-processing protein FCF1